MKKYFVTSDVHGYFDVLVKELNKCGWEQDNPDHIFVSCGDLLDRGEQPRECLQFVNKLPDDRKILIKGNHEILLQQAINRGALMYHDWTNGTGYTVYNLNGEYNISQASGIKTYAYLLNVKDDPDYKDYYYNTCRYALLYNNENKYVFTHAWVSNEYTGQGSWERLKQCCNDFTDFDIKEWDNIVIWENGMDKWNRGFKVDENAQVVCGHFHTSWGHANLRNLGVEFSEYADSGIEEHFEPFIDDGIIALDACCAWTNKLNVYVIEGDNFVCQKSI